jgi:Transposase, Mutator family
MELLPKRSSRITMTGCPVPNLMDPPSFIDGATTKAAEIVGAEIDEALSYYRMPSEHWRSIKTDSPLKRLIREIQRRSRVGAPFLTATRR